MTSYRYAQEPLSIAKTLDHGFQLYTSSFRAVVVLAAAAALFSSLSALVPFDPENPDPSVTPVLVALTFFGALVSFGFINAIYIQMDRVATGEPDISAAMRRGFRLLIPVLIATLLYVLAVILGLVLLVIPGIIVGVSLYLYFPLLALGRAGIIESLKLSHRLVWPHWWRVLVLASVSMVFYILVSLAAGVASAAGIWVGFIASVLVDTLVLPVVYAIMLALLQDLTLRHAGDDLEARLEPA